MFRLTVFAIVFVLANGPGALMQCVAPCDSAPGKCHREDTANPPVVGGAAHGCHLAVADDGSCLIDDPTPAPTAGPQVDVAPQVVVTVLGVQPCKTSDTTAHPPPLDNEPVFTVLRI